MIEKALCSRVTDKLKTFRNFQLKFVSKDITGFGVETFASDTLPEMVQKLIAHYHRYLKQGEDEKASEYRMRVDKEKKSVARQLGSLKTIFINADVKKLTRGAIMKEVVQGNWIVINPLTKTHCVSDCLAILELYRSDKALVAVKSYIKKRGNEIADKYDIKDGCPESLLNDISKDFSVNIAIGADKDYEELTEDAYMIIEDEHCYICLNPENERSH